MVRLILSLSLLAALATPAFAQVSLTEASPSYGESFDSFRAAGFAPSPAAGQLDSDLWGADATYQSAATEDTVPYIERTAPSVYGRGTSPGGVVTGGIYAFQIAGNYAIGMQGSNDYFHPGYVALRVRNDGGHAISSLRIDYRVCLYNDETRATRHQLYLAAYGPSPRATVAVGPEWDTSTAPAGAGWVCQPASETVATAIPVGAYVDVLFDVHEGDGGGRRSEVAFDDVVVQATFTSSLYCGDGVNSAGEACDDGNTRTEFQCPYGLGTCTRCNADCSATLSLTGPACGDGWNDPEERCDDGNAVTETECPYGIASCSACSADCQSSLFLSGNVCGDGVLHASEACDDGNTMSETECAYGTATCTGCADDCSATLALSGNTCGDGVTHASETCDDGNTATETACPYGTASCTLCAGDCGATLSLSGNVCGDGVMDAMEACDDGNTATETACPYGTAMCMGCAADCSAALTLTGAYCGDGNQDAGEICDDGDTVTAEECEYGTEVCNVCAGDCQSVVRRNGPVCGDGNLDLDHETCDDGNLVSGDGCSARCELEVDGGVIMPDAGVADGGIASDGGVGELDGSVPELDGGVAELDGATSTDAGTSGEAESSGCAAGGSAPIGGAWVLLLGALVRRRRR